MKEYIDIQLIERKPKTFVYSVRSISQGNELGRIKWYGGWRQYVFFPEAFTIWSHDCLNKIEEFLKQVNMR